MNADCEHLVLGPDGECARCGPLDRVCMGCGCTDAEPCETADGACHWVSDDLCSACAEEA